MIATKATRLLQCAVALAWISFAGRPAQSALVGYWDFNGNLNDSSGNGNNGTFNGSPLPTFSSDVPPLLGVGQSLSVGGGTGHVLVPDSNSLDISSSLTIAAWVKTIGNVGWDGIVAKSPSDGSGANHAGNYELRVENGTHRPTFLHQRGGLNDTVTYPGGAAVPDSTWTHVAVTATNGGAVNFYLNGVPAGTAPVVGLFGATNNNPLYIGSRADLFTTMDGLIDDLKIYNNALSASEIFTLATGIAPETPYAKLPGVLARASSEYTPDGRFASNAVNGNGIVGKSHVAVPPGGNMWLSNGSDPAPTFEMDLGGVTKVDQLRVWNYNETGFTARSVKTADIYVAGQNGVYAASPTLANVSLNQAPGTQTDFSQTLNLGGVNARYIKIVPTSNYGDAAFTGLSEVNVVGTPVAGLAPLPATIKSVSSNLAGFNRQADYVVNKAGMEFGDRHSAAPDGTMWLSQGTFAGAPADTAPQITFDLGSVKPLDHVQVWNYNEYVPGPRKDELLGRGVSMANILIAGEDQVFTPFRLFQSFDKAAEVGNSADFSQIINLAGANARYVKFEIIANHNGKNFQDPTDDDGMQNFVGLSEVKFFAAVPEPSGVALAATGLLALGLVARRRAA